MIQAGFFESNGKLNGFSIKGHAGYAESGYDIVCASVSSAVQLTANTITEGFGVKAEVSVIGDNIMLELSQPNRNAEVMLEMLKLHIEMLSEEFPKTIKINTTEV